MDKTNLVIVESPAKAKTINRYLGKDFVVLASFGHVRDLLAKDGSVNPEDNFSLTWEVDNRGKEHLQKIVDACRGATHLYLATDPDREGEAISWHVYEELKNRKALTSVKRVERIVFHEITEQAVRESLSSPRELDQKLIDAYLARRVLDYLVGFNLSPVLWRKLPGAKSAGRVQSVALRLISDREHEIENFQSQEYWSIMAECYNSENVEFSARLSRLKGEELKKFSITSEEDALEAVGIVQSCDWMVSDIQEKQKSRRPYAPFTTSTLQQDASHKLRFSASQTMQVAQKLYESGLITYMRTDSTVLSKEAISQVRELISSTYGGSYLPTSPIYYKTKTKNAQEAHEAIRPTKLSMVPQKSGLTDTYQAKLYELIWKRTVASQMKSAIFDMTNVLIESTDKQVALKASGNVIKFDGFLKIYNNSYDNDSSDNGAKDDEKKILPPMKEGDVVPCKDVQSTQHWTQPLPRYSEAGLVKKMEEIGIGRPSTYASILKILQEREYVKLEKRSFMILERGRLVSIFLSSFFEKYVDYEFTAAMENNLDAISNGEEDWKVILRDFWENFYVATQSALNLDFTVVRAEIDRALCGLFFKKDENGCDEASRKCPLCSDGRLSVNYGKHGIFANCSGYPACSYTQNGGDDSGSADSEYPVSLGDSDGKEVTLRKGPYGLYVQLGEGKKKDVKRVGVPKAIAAAGVVDLAIAEQLLELPRLLGEHSDTGDDILASFGPYGAYLKHGSKYVSVDEGEDLLGMTLDRAIELIARDKVSRANSGGSRSRSSQALKTLGTHEDGSDVSLFKGFYGHYVKWQKTNAGVPRGVDIDSITLEDALVWIDNKLKNPSKKAKFKRSGAKKAGAKKAGVKKSGAKKAVARKAV